MNNQTDTVHSAGTNALLSPDSDRAVQQMIMLSQKLVSMAETETQNLIQNDIFSFAVLQDEKEKVANSYVKASAEFRKRLNEFRGIDRSLLDRLDTLQQDLAQRTKSNNVIVQRLNKRSTENAQATLLAAQEIAQDKVVHFPNQQNNEKLARNSQDSVE